MPYLTLLLAGWLTFLKGPTRSSRPLFTQVQKRDGAWLTPDQREDREVVSLVCVECTIKAGRSFLLEGINFRVIGERRLTLLFVRKLWSNGLRRSRYWSPAHCARRSPFRTTGTSFAFQTLTLVLFRYTRIWWYRYREACYCTGRIPVYLGSG